VNEGNPRQCAAFYQTKLFLFGYFAALRQGGQVHAGSMNHHALRTLADHVTGEFAAAFLPGSTDGEPGRTALSVASQALNGKNDKKPSLLPSKG
jgi:hypothetical protein